MGHNPDGKSIPTGGTAAARQHLQHFLETKATTYYWQLSYPGALATTGLSPYLKFGAISLRECYHTIAPHLQSAQLSVRRSCQQLISRLRWGSGFTQRFRYLPQLELCSLYSVFDQSGWQFDPQLYQAWQQGTTGFPIIDAAARCLQATGGWLSLNFRTRAIYASFLSNLLGVDWRWGALHFMRHLVDGDCPIDHYQWAMQAGVTHCIDKSWTRIYHPGQVAVDRCDPAGHFIKQWLPELAHLDANELGQPRHGYLPAIINYAQARRQRVALLTQQRQCFREQDNILPHLARLPVDLRPFGHDRYPSHVAWADQGCTDLFPAALELDPLNPAQGLDLRTWFIAHVNIPPHRSSRPPNSRSRRRPDPNLVQLSLFP